MKLVIAVAILAAWVFAVNVTDVSSTVGWVAGLAAFVLALFDVVAARR